MTTDLTLRDADAYEWNRMKLLAESVAGTEFVPKGYRNNVPAMLACIQYGKEVGLGPMESLQMIDVIDGKASQSAELMVAQVRQAGHSLVPTEMTNNKCTVTGKRVDSGDEMSFTFTWEMAKRANLTGKSNWKNYPEAMLWARAASQLCRMLFPDVLSGVSYVPEELGSEELPPELIELAATEDEGDDVVDVENDGHVDPPFDEVADAELQSNGLIEATLQAHLDHVPADKAVKEDQMEWVRKLFTYMDLAGFTKWSSEENDGKKALRIAVENYTQEPIDGYATTGLSSLVKEKLVAFKQLALAAAIKTLEDAKPFE